MATQTPRFEGVWPILPTPFDENEALDLTSLARLVKFMAAAGMDGVTVLGVLGEANRLTDAERDRVIEAAVTAAGGMPVCVGTTHPGTAACAAYGRRAEELGAAAVMISPSREPTPNEEKVFEFFQRAAEGFSLPIVVQDHPASSRTWMPVPLLKRLVREIPQVACIKEEHPPTPGKVATLLNALAEERRVTLLQGLGALYGIFDLERGAHGFMTGFAFPEALRAMVAAVGDNRLADARALYRRFLPLIVFEQQPALAIRKEVYRLRGLLATATVRHPGAQLDAATAGQLNDVLAQVLPGEDLTRPLVL